MNNDFIIDNEHIMASVCFDDDCQFEWEAKHTNTDEIITSLILEIKVLKAILDGRCGERLKPNDTPEFYNLNP